MTRRIQPTTGPAYGICSVCGRSVVLKVSDGRIRRHGFALGQYDPGCKGSGRRPVAPPAVDTRTHDRRTQ